MLALLSLVSALASASLPIAVQARPLLHRPVERDQLLIGGLDALTLLSTPTIPSLPGLPTALLAPAQPLINPQFSVPTGILSFPTFLPISTQLSALPLSLPTDLPALPVSPVLEPAQSLLSVVGVASLLDDLPLLPTATKNPLFPFFPNKPHRPGGLKAVRPHRITRTVTSTATARPTQASSPKNDTDFIHIAYVPDWVNLEMEKIDFSLYNSLHFSFALPGADQTLYFGQEDSGAQLRRLVKAAHASNTSVSIVIGGWTGSAHFSDAVLTNSSRTKFIDNIAAMVDAYGVDGVETDWEYPNQKGADGNVIRSEDTANMLLFLQDLRKKLGKDKKISLAVPENVWYGTDGQPMKDVSCFAEPIDYILIMNYDTTGSSATPGPNAPLSDGCKDSQNPESNAVAAVSAWRKAGMPAKKILLGLPSYGYVSQSSATKLVHKREIRRVSRRNTSDGDLSGFYGQQIEFNQLEQYGVIEQSKNGTWRGAKGFTRAFDKCSQSPYLYNGQTVVTYDDPVSLKIKAKFAKSAGLKGTGIWDLSSIGDSDRVLSRAARDGLGI